jgi:hypothetical protein
VIRSELREGVRVAEERPPRVPRSVDRRLVTRVEQQRARPDELALGQGVALVGDLCEA